jgi:hypothetical protein
MRHVMKHVGRGMLAGVLVLGGVGVVAARRATSPAGVVEGPAEWVPFHADYYSSTNGELRIRGRVCRTSDGSMIYDTRSARAGSGRRITIFNIARRTLYRMRDDSWEARPLLIAPDGYRPRTSLSAQVLVAVPDKVGAFEVYRQTTGTGDILTVAPALNFYPVIVESGRERTRQWLENIVLEEPSGEPLEPPAGVPVVHKTEPVRIGRVAPDR